MSSRVVSRFALTVLSLLALSSSGAAAPGSGSPPGGSSEPPNRRLSDDVSGDVTTAQRGLRPAIDVEGRVINSSGAPLTGVLVKAFANGVLTGSTTTASPDGSFRLSANPMQSHEGSSVIWFQSPDPTAYVDTEVVLWVGDAAAAKKLFPPCTEFVTLTAGISGTVEITMRSEAERQRIVLDSECLEAE